MWGIGVARVNAYKIYAAMWEEEKKKGRTDLPAKWTAGEFIEQLAYDMMFPEQTLLHRRMLERDEELDESSIEGRSLSSFGSNAGLQPEDDREWDFSCKQGIDEFLKEDPGRKLTPQNMKGTYHSRRIDGKFHGMVKAFPTMRCQYCYYIWKNEYDPSEQELYLFMQRNRTDTVRCLRCNVNLCTNCWNEWHGIDMRDTNGLLGR